jgi:hypothetical protein
MFVRPASAHVKWFCAFNVAGQPEGLENVLCPDFEKLIGLSLVALMRYPSGEDRGPGLYWRVGKYFSRVYVGEQPRTNAALDFAEAST